MDFGKIWAASVLPIGVSVGAGVAIYLIIILGLLGVRSLQQSVSTGTTWALLAGSLLTLALVVLAAVPFILNFAILGWSGYRGSSNYGFDPVIAGAVGLIVGVLSNIIYVIITAVLGLLLAGWIYTSSANQITMLGLAVTGAMSIISMILQLVVWTAIWGAVGFFMGMIGGFLAETRKPKVV